MKERLDILLVHQGLAASREKAKAMIAAGSVFVDGQKAEKASALTDTQAVIEVRGETLGFVSRGGLKLERALNCFQLSLTDLVCMDVGASTGGFTDCMLQRGAKCVYAVDVGHDQLAEPLRRDDRVVVMERTNIRHLTPEQLPELMQFVSVDVSFISLKLVLPVVRDLLTGNGRAVCLVKPQFEAGRKNVGKKGVVRDRKVHLAVLKETIAFAQSVGFDVLNLDYSPVKGPEGNIEYLMLLQKADGGRQGDDRQGGGQQSGDRQGDDRQGGGQQSGGRQGDDRQGSGRYSGRSLLPGAPEQVVQEAHQQLK